MHIADQADAELAVMLARIAAEVNDEVTLLRAAGCSDEQIAAFLRSVPS